MLEGITVLNETEIMKPVDWYEWCIVILLVLIAIFLSVGLTYIGRWWGLTMSILVIPIFLLMMCLLYIHPQEPTGRYRYECLIDESVSMTEVYERYEIIEQRGDIWVLEDKE